MTQRLREVVRRSQPDRRDVPLAVLLLVGAGLVFVFPANPLVVDAAQYADTAQHVANGDGFVTTALNHIGDFDTPRPGFYPPGLPLLLTPFAALGDVQVGSRLLSLCYLLALVWAAGRLGGRSAAVVAAGLALLSPFLPLSARTVMADATGATLALLALALLAREPVRRRLLVVGFFTGLAPLVRLSNAPLPLAAVAAAPRGGRRWVLLGATPGVLGLLLFQWYYFGSPLASGYPSSIGWSVSNVIHPVDGDHSVQIGVATPGGPPPNVLPGWLYWSSALGVWWTFAPPFVGLLGVIAAWRSRLTPAARFALFTCAGLFAFCVSYYYQASRIMAPAATMLVAFASVAIAQLRSGSAATPLPTRS